MRPSPKERLLALTKKTKSCWLFTGSKIRGYGQFHFNKKPTLAHRASYEIFVGKIPDGLWVCHKCDVRNCINPKHFFIGTRSDNMRDCVSKGRLYWQRYSYNGSKINCSRGHRFSYKNTTVAVYRNKEGEVYRIQRQCKACRKVRKNNNK